MSRTIIPSPTAYHEAGHTLADHVLGFEICKVSIVPDERLLGYAEHSRRFPDGRRVRTSMTFCVRPLWLSWLAGKPRSSQPGPMRVAIPTGARRWVMPCTWSATMRRTRSLLKHNKRRVHWSSCIGTAWLLLRNNLSAIESSREMMFARYLKGSVFRLGHRRRSSTWRNQNGPDRQEDQESSLLSIADFRWPRHRHPWRPFP